MSKKFGTRILRGVITVCLALAAAGACGGKTVDGSGNSNTNWLETCGTDSECHDGYSCLCGQCTLTCGTTSDCGSLSGATCVSPTWSGCRTINPNVGMCVPGCNRDADCASGYVCKAGACAIGETGAGPGAVVGTGGGSGAGGSGTTGAGNVPTGAGASAASDFGPCNALNFAAYPTTSSVSFQNDVLPLLAASCTEVGCHNDVDRKASLSFGPANMQPPFDTTTAATAYGAIGLPAATVNNGTVLRVDRGHPERSFLIDTLAGTQGNRGYACTNQDSSHAIVLPPLTCGDVMPPGISSYCDTSRADFDKIVEWVLAGGLGN